MRTIEIGDKLLQVILFVTYNSACAPQILFWEDVDGTQPADLSAVVTSHLEVTVDGVTTITWPADVVNNIVTIDLEAIDTNVDWDTKPFNLVFMQPSRTVVLSGEVQVQR
jgi:hypothetical protein